MEIPCFECHKLVLSAVWRYHALNAISLCCLQYGDDHALNAMSLCCCLQYGDDHAKAIEDLWATLVVCWPGNLQVIIRYIIVITGLAPNVLLPYVRAMSTAYYSVFVCVCPCVRMCMRACDRK